jgi:glycosyltransferase involved in cell wall biosynthesis
MAELVSVIMPVYNAAKFVKASVDSILGQTYPAIEICIVDDGSTDGSSAMLDSFSDPRINIIHTNNRGVANALNTALEQAKGKYIARQDADDLSMPSRIEKEVAFLEKNNAYDLVGAQARIIDPEGAGKGFLKHAATNAKLQYDLLWDSPFVSSTTMFRSKCLETTGKFYSGSDLFEDYNMWSEIAKQSKVANLDEVLLDYRELSSGLSFTTTNSSLRVFNQRRKNISSAFPSFDKKIVEALALSGSSRTRISSLSEVRRIYKTMFTHFEKMDATPEEMKLIRADLAERMNAFRWMTGENKNALYYPGRLLEKIFYPKQ